MIVDVNWIGQPNVIEYVYAEEQGSYLVGLAAALQAKEDGVANPKFGFIGGVPGATITKFEMGYIQGIKAIYPDAEIVDYYANDWGKPELAKAQAKNWYDNGVYAIFSAAGGTGNGTIAQAKEYRSQGKNVWAIGVDSDQYAEGVYADGKSAVLTSMVKRVETSAIYGTIYALLTLAVSVFALTSLDTGTRLSRFMFSELFLKDDEASYKDAKGVRKVLTHPLFGTTLMVVIGCILGGLKLAQIWGLFGAANQLLAGIALMAVAAWLGNVGKNNKMFFIPMIFMLAATLTSLVITVIGKIKAVAAGTALWGDWFQLLFASAMAILAVILVVEGFQTFKKQMSKK